METSGAERRSSAAVLVLDTVDISRPLETLRERLLADERWLEPLADAAERENEHVLMRVGPSKRLHRQVRAELGGWRRRGSSLVVSLRWKAVEHSSLLPVLDGDLEIAPLDGGHCRLTLAASYVPPLGGTGRLLDRAVLHVVAESTLRSFLLGIARAIEGLPAG